MVFPVIPWSRKPKAKPKTPSADPSSPPPISQNPLAVLLPSPLRPPCRAEDRIFLWRGIHTPPPNTLAVPVLERLASLAYRHRLEDTSSYGSGLRKFMIFCDTFSVPEGNRLPASFPLVHSFALWATSNPAVLELPEMDGIPFEPIAPSTTRKYISAIRTWHLAQGWSDPLTSTDHERIEDSLTGLLKLQGARKQPPRPPVTLPMLETLHSELNLDDPFDACVWAMAACAFWGLMRFGEVSVKSRAAFDPARHLTRGDAHLLHNLAGQPYFSLHLPSAKMAAPGEVQEVILNEQGRLCAHKALFNLAQVVPAQAGDPLFSWRDRCGAIRPMVRDRALERINAIFSVHGWGTTFGHSFRIGGASFLLAMGTPPDIVQMQGRWRSLAYQVYIRSFAEASGRHTANLSQQFGF